MSQAPPPPKYPQIVQQFTDGIYTYKQERIRCGKPNCTKCPHPQQGGYWYVYWSVKGLVQKRYIGKVLKLIGREAAQLLPIATAPPEGETL